VNTSNAGEPTGEDIRGWLLWGAFFFMAAQSTSAPHVLPLVLWAGTLIAPFAHELLVQVLVPLIITLVFAPEATKRLLRGKGQRRS